MADVSFTYDSALLTQLINQVKEITCDALVKEKLLKPEDAKAFKESYALYLRRPGMISDLWDKVWGKPKDGTVQFDFSKTIGLWGREDGEKPEEEQKTRFEKLQVEKEDK